MKKTYNNKVVDLVKIYNFQISISFSFIIIYYFQFFKF
jgi:hypothetical protein